jgi:hypothetical protein
MKAKAFYNLFSASVFFLGTSLLSQQINEHSSINNKEPFMTTQEQASVLPFNDYLFLTGERLGCYFTLEYRAYALAGRASRIHMTVTNDVSVSSIPELIANLRRNMGGFAIEQDSKNPKVIHVIEQFLENNTNYALNKKITINYSGLIGQCTIKNAAGQNISKGNGLIPVVSQQVKGIQGGTEEAGSQGAVNDCVTVVNIHATNQTVRSIFTDCIPLDKYKAVLWRAVITNTNDTPQVLVQFYGPK